MANEWYVRIGNTERGPVAPEQLRDLATQGKIKPEMLVKIGPSGPWFPASRVKGLFAAPSSASSGTAPSPPRRPTPQPQPERQPEAEAAPQPAAPPAPVAQVVGVPTHTDHHAEQHASQTTSLGVVARLTGMALAIVGVFCVFLAAIIFHGYFSHPADQLVGKWEMVGKDERVQFASDGTVILTKYGGQVYAKWERISGGRLKFNGGSFGSGASDVYKFDLSGDDLTLKGISGLESKYKRVAHWTKDATAASSN
jgi:hypothetical protein